MSPALVTWHRHFGPFRFARATRRQRGIPCAGVCRARQSNPRKMGPKAGERIRRSMLHGVVARVGIEPRTVVFRAKAAQSARLLKRNGTDWRVLPQYWVVSHFVSHRAWSETAATPSAAPISVGPLFPKARPERRTNGAARNSRKCLRSPVYSGRMRLLPGPQPWAHGIRWNPNGARIFP